MVELKIKKMSAEEYPVEKIIRRKIDNGKVKIQYFISNNNTKYFKLIIILTKD